MSLTQLTAAHCVMVAALNRRFRFKKHVDDLSSLNCAGDGALSPLHYAPLISDPLSALVGPLRLAMNVQSGNEEMVFG